MKNLADHFDEVAQLVKELDKKLDNVIERLEKLEQNATN